jgi:hypothetical protein
LPDFSWSKIPKRGKYTKLPQNKQMAKNISNGRKIYQMVIKDTDIFHSNALQNLPQLGFWFESKPSGNPGQSRR